MQTVIIIEDEAPAARRLTSMLKNQEQQYEVIACLDSIEDSVQWLQANTLPDLIFMDIMLADGQSFEIFDKIRIDVPVIFTTAYDEYALKAFQVNSVDYLLKPIDPLLLAKALKKHDQI
jgi:two-component system LytT family response regulator